MPHRPLKRSALTLTEVLIVLIVIAVLAIITFAIARPVRGRISQTKCASNLSSLHRATMLYRLDHSLDTAFVGDVRSMGLPFSIRHNPSQTMYIGKFEEWQCDAPKRPSLREPYWPHYEYPLLLAHNNLGSKYIADHASEFGSKLPLYSDLNHQNHATHSIYAPRVTKTVLFVNLEGAFRTHQTTASFAGIPGDLKPYGFELIGGSE